MSNSPNTQSSTQIFSKSLHPVLDVFGPTIQFLTTPEEAGESLCVMEGIIPPSRFIPLHAHPDVECFRILSGQLEVLVEDAGKFNWVVGKAGDFIFVPGNAKHGFRNNFSEPAVCLVTTTANLGHFFEEIGRPLTPGSQPAPPTPEELERFIGIAIEHHYWMGSPEENAAIGIQLF
jgi:quercetin dioxygenase-like cupin family protein